MHTFIGVSYPYTFTVHTYKARQYFVNPWGVGNCKQLIIIQFKLLVQNMLTPLKTSAIVNQLTLGACIVHRGFDSLNLFTRRWLNVQFVTAESITKLFWPDCLTNFWKFEESLLSLSLLLQLFKLHYYYHLNY